MQRRSWMVVALVAFSGSVGAGALAYAQEYGPADRASPGDAMIQRYLAQETERLERSWLEGIKTQGDWERRRPEWKQEYFYMLGLAPMPEKTPLRPTITGTLRGDGYVVDMIHYQSRPRLYVTGNLYRPAAARPGERLPAVFYVCGHSNQGRNGNKTAYQSHGIWFARHGYVCLTVDSLQLGEIGAIHHGTYREGRWWWHSRGYTPAGVECLNGMRGIDYLLSRPDVDPQRIAVTGISGGGAATFWIAAADERAKVAVPVSGMADLASYVPNRVINGHCDCMFLYNTFQWPWARIAALIAPRPLLFVNSDQDRIFPMDANDRVINRLERVYSLFGAGDRVDALVSIGGHAYRQDIRQGAYRFINIHLKDDPLSVEDSERDLVASEGKERKYPIEPEKLRVFPKDSDLPKDELNTTIDQHFVPMAAVATPQPGRFNAWKAGLMAELRRVVFRSFPERVPPARLVAETEGRMRIETEAPIQIEVNPLRQAQPAGKQGRVLLVVDAAETPEKEKESKWLEGLCGPDDVAYRVAPRGIGATQWTHKNPPNYVERSHVLLGRTVDAGRVWDVIAAARLVRARAAGPGGVVVVGEGAGAVLAAYAALWEPEIEGVILRNPPATHMDPAAPHLLNVLRVCDVEDVLGMLAPRPLTLCSGGGQAWRKVTAAYAAAGQPARLTIKAE